MQALEARINGTSRDRDPAPGCSALVPPRGRLSFLHVIAMDLRLLSWAA